MVTTLHVLAWAWVGFVGMLVVLGIGSWTMHSGARRDANRRTIRKALKDGGWIYLSLAFKTLAFLFPHAGHRVARLYIVPLVIAGTNWILKGMRALIRRRKRMQPAQTAYTRSLRAVRSRKR